jgi:two-component system response regulator FlrC
LAQLLFPKTVIFSAVPAATPFVWRVLLVDDDPLVLDSIRRMLEFDQRHVITATGAAEALSLCEKETFDLVILDYLMPGMRGDTLAITIKERHPNLPIIMITADADKMEALECPPAVDLLMGKPFQFTELREALNKLLVKA